MYFLTFSVLCLSACIQLVSSQALASWMTNIGPAVVWQNATTGDLMYSIDTGSGPGAGGYTAWQKLPITTPARNNTLLGATGFTGGDGDVYSYVYYITTGGYIGQGNFNCNPEASCALTGLFDISSAVGSSGVNNATGLAAAQRTGWDGYRVIYHDEEGLTREVRYSGEQNITQWTSSVVVISDPTEIVGTVTMDLGNNLTAYAIDTNGTIIPSALTGNTTWTPFTPIKTSTWEAWDPSNVTISATVDPNDNLTKSIFYIGTDRSIHEIDTTDNWDTWSIAPNPGTDVWPLADEVNARFTATNDSSGVVLSLFYISNGNLVQASRAGGKWSNFLSIFQTLDTAPPSSTSSSSPTTTPTSTPSSTTTPASKSNNNGAKVGAGVGIGVGVPVLAGLIFLGYWLLRRKRRNAANAPAHEEAAPAYAYHEPKPPVPDKDPNEMSPDNVPRAEMGEWNPQYELPTEGDGNGQVYEAPGHDVPTPTTGKPDGAVRYN